MWTNKTLRGPYSWSPDYRFPAVVRTVSAVFRTLSEETQSGPTITMLLARIEALLRRAPSPADQSASAVYQIDGLRVDVHVAWLRQKLEEDPRHPRRIITVHGCGYKFVG